MTEPSPAALDYPVLGNGKSHRCLIASLLGFVGGLGAAGAVWLPLASLAGLGDVGSFEYSHPRGYACVTVAVLVALLSLARCFRLSLLFTGILCGVLFTTALDLVGSLQEMMNTTGSGAAPSELSSMVRETLAHSSLKSGSLVLPLCTLACAIASGIGAACRFPRAGERIQTGERIKIAP